MRFSMVSRFFLIMSGTLFERRGAVGSEVAGRVTRTNGVYHISTVLGVWKNLWRVRAVEGGDCGVTCRGWAT